MAIFKTYKLTATPGTWENSSVYFIYPTGASDDYIECYVTSSSGVPRRLPTWTDINTLITASSGGNEIIFVPDIAARNALTAEHGMYVFVQDASADSTVGSGGATYIYNSSTSTWIKVSEAESLDVQLTWDALTGKPSSTVAAIDAAVTASHTHTNQTQLDKINQDGSGNMTYDGATVRTSWNEGATVAW